MKNADPLSVPLNRWKASHWLRYLARTAITLALIGGLSPLNAATYTWTGAADNDWNTAGNWDDGMGPAAVPPQNGDTVIFAGAAATIPVNIINVPAGIQIASVTFNGNATAFTLSGGKIELGAGGGTTLTVDATSGDHTVQNDIDLAASQTWDIGSGRVFTPQGILGEVGGSYSLTKAGPGSLILSGANTYSGGTFLNAGILQANNAQALGTTGDITFGGGTLQYTATSAGTDWSTRFKNSTSAITLDTGGQTVMLAGGIDGSNTGGLIKTGTGTLFMGVTERAGSVAGATISGLSSTADLKVGMRVFSSAGGVPANATIISIDGPNQITISAAGGAGPTAATISFDPVNTFAGDILVNGGTLQINGGTGTADVTSLGAPGLRNITLDGGTFALVGVSNYNPSASSKQFIVAAGGGGFDVTGGRTIQFDDVPSAGQLGQLSGSGTLTKTGAGTLYLRGQTNFTGQILLNAGIFDARDDSTYSGGLTMANLTTNLVNSTLRTAAPLIINGEVTFTPGLQKGTFSNVDFGSGTRMISVTNSTAPSGGVEFSGAIANATGLTKVGAGVLTLSGANTYSGLTTVGNGMLVLNNASALPGGIDATATAGESALSLGTIAAAQRGVIGLANGDFLRPLGAADGQVQWLGSGGFAGVGGTRIVNLGGASAPVLWNSGGFVPTGFVLSLGHTNANGTVDFQNQINLNAANRTIDVANGVADVDAILSGGFTSTGTAALIKTGAGTLDLPNASATGTATFTLNGGVVRIGNASALGANTVTMTIGTLASKDSTSYTLGNVVTLNSAANSGISIGQATGGTGELIFNGAGANGFGLGTTVKRITNDANATINAIMSGSGGGITKFGEGRLTLGGNANTFTGATIVSNGVLRLEYSANNNTKLADGAALTLSGGSIDLSGGSHIEVVGSTTLAQGASAITRSSGTSVLRLNAITRLAGATIDFGAASIADTDTANNAGGILGGWATVGNNWAVSAGVAADTAITGLAAYYTTTTGGNTAGNYNNVNMDVTSGPTMNGAITPNSIRFNDSTARTLTLNAAGASIATGGILVGTGANTGTITGGTLTSGAADLVVHQSGANEFRINSQITGGIGLTKTGSGTLILTNLTAATVNNYTGPTFINAGTLAITNDLNLGAVPGAVTAGHLNIDGATLELRQANGTTIHTNRGIYVGPSGATFMVTNSSAVLSLNGVITGPGGITKTGAGEITLIGNNTYTGPTIINGGILNVQGGNDSRLGTAPGTYVPDQLVINGATFAILNNDLTLSANRGITIGASGATIDDGSGRTLTIPGIITGTGSLTKTGSGDLVLQGINTYSGGTILSAGTLRMNNDQALGSGALTVRNATFEANDYSTRRISNPLILDGVTTFGEIGTTGQGSLIFTGGITLNRNVTNTVAGNGLTYASPVMGAFNLTKNGASQMFLTADNTFSGVLTISRGTLTVSGAGDIAEVAAIVVTNEVSTANLAPTLELGSVSDSSIIDRVGNSVSVALNQGASLILNGTTVAGTTTEDIGALTIGPSGTGSKILVTLNPGAGQDVQLQADSFIRTLGSTVLFRGANLGSAAGANTSRIIFDTTPAMIGGGGSAGTDTISIMPSAMADTSAVGVGGTSFVTYDPTLGIRLLDVGTEYDTTLTGTTNRNVNLTGNSTLSAGQRINALRLAGGDLTIDPGITLTNASGAILFVTDQNISGPGQIFVPAADHIIHVGGVTPISPEISAVLAGWNGLTISMGSTNSTLTLSGANSYVGPTFINNGTVILNNASALGAPAAGIPGSVRLNTGSVALDLNGHSISIGRLDGAFGVGIVTNSSATPVSLSINTTEGNSEFRPNIGDSGTGAMSLIKRGPNTLSLLGSNTIAGSIDVQEGQLTLDGNNQRFPNVSSVTIRNSATNLLNYANSNTGGNDRINNAAAVTMEGARLIFTNNANSSTSFSEILGALTLNSGGSTIVGARAASGQTSVLTFSSLTRNAGATMNFAGGNLGDDNRNRMVFTAPPTLVNGLIGGWATVNGTDFATYNVTGTISVDEYNRPAIVTTNALEGTFADTVNLVLNAGNSPVLTANRSLSSLNLRQSTSASTVDLGLNTLNIGTGGILASGSFNGAINNGTLTAGGTPDTLADELFFHTYSAVANPLAVGAVVADNGSDVVHVVKAGSGVLTLTGANTFTGDLTVNEGVLRLGTGTLPAANTLRLNGGTIASSDATARTINNPVTLSGRATLGEASVGTGALDFMGGFTVGSGRRFVTVDNNPISGTHTISGNITGSGELVKTGVADLALAGSYGSTGSLTIEGGTVLVTGSSGQILTSGTTIRSGGTLVLDNVTFNSGDRIAGDVNLLSGALPTTFELRGDGTTSISESLGTLSIYGTSGTVTIKTTQTIGGTTALTFGGLNKSPLVILDFYGDGIGDSDENRVFITGQATGAILGATITSALDGTDDAAYDPVLGVYRLLNYDLSYTPNSHPGGGSLAGTPTGWTGSTIKANPQGGVRLTLNDIVSISQLKLDNDGSANTPGYNGVDLNGGTLKLVSGALRSSGTASQSVFGGTLTAGTGLAPATLIITVGDGNLLTVGATIDDNDGQNVTLVKVGGGTNLLTSTANTYEGKTIISAGTLGIAADGSLGPAPGAVVADQLTINGGALKLGNGVDIVPTRGITLGAQHGTIRVDDSDAATITSVITGSGRNLTKVGTGSLTLNRANTYSGITTLNEGILAVETNATALGTGTLVINGGNLIIRNDSNLAVNRNTTVSGNATITTDRLTSGAGVTHTLGTLAIGGQTLTVTAGNTTPTSGLQGLTFGNVTMSGPATFNVLNGGGGAATYLTLGSINNGGNLLTFDGDGSASVGAISGAGGLRKTGAGSVTNTAASTYGGSTAIENGSFAISGGNDRLPTGTTVTLGAGTTSGKLILGQPSNARNQTLAGLLTSGTGTDNRVVGAATSASTLTLNIASGENVFGGILGGPGANENQLILVKSGAGTLTLSGANTYLGNTTISAGVLKLGASEVIPNGTGNGNLSITGTLDLNGYSETVNGFSGAGTVDTVAGGTPTLTIGDGNGTGTFSGTIQNTAGTLALTKVGTGTIQLSTAANTYGGETKISDGVLRLNAANSLPGGIGVSGGTSALNLNGGVVGLGAADFSRALGVGVDQVQFTSSGGFAAYGAATRNVNLGGALAPLTWGTGSFVPNGSALILAAADSVSGDLVNFQNPINLDGAARTVQVNNGANGIDAALSGVISSASGSLIKTGGGLLNLSAHNSFGGGITVSAGTLRGTGVSPAGATVAPTTDPFGANTITLEAGTTLQVRDNGDGTATSQTFTYDNNLILNGDATLNADRDSGAGSLKTFRFGTLTLSAGVSTVTSTANNTNTIFIGGGATLAQNTAFNVTAGTLSIGNANSTTGSGTSLTDGASTFTLAKSGSGNLTLGKTLVDGVISVTGGTLQLNNNGNILPGGIVLNSGTLLLNRNDGVLGAASSPDVVANGGTIDMRYTNAAASVGFDINGNSTISLRTNSSANVVFDVESVSVAATASQLTLHAQRTSGSSSGGTLALNAPITTSGPLQINATGANSYVAAISGANASLTLGGDITFNPTTASLIVDAVINDGAGSLNVSKIGTGLLALTKANTYDGTTTISEGTLRILDGGALGSTAAGTVVQSGATLELDGSLGNLTVAENLVLNGVSAAGGALSSVVGNNLVTGNISADNSIYNVNSGSTLELSGVVSGTGSVEKIGDGTLTLSGVNEYTGSTEIRNGTLVVAGNAPVSANGVLGNSASAVTVGHTSSGASDLALLVNGAHTVARDVNVLNQGNAITLGGTHMSGTATFSGAVALAKSVSLTAAAGGTVDFSGAISGSGAGITKIGSGTVRLSGGSANTFTGNAVVSAGTLELAKDAALQSPGQISINTGGTLLLSGGTGDTIGNAVPMTLDGGTFNTGGLSEQLGALTLSANSTLDMGSGASVINFADSSLATWTGGTTLMIMNWSGVAQSDGGTGGGIDQLIFGTDSNGLTAGQLSQIKFQFGWGVSDAVILSNGEVIAAVPEPATVIALLALLAMVGFHERRRIASLFKRIYA